MAAPTAISCTVNDSEYSRYEAGRSKVTATAILTGSNIAGEQIQFELRKARRQRDAIIETVTVVATTSTVAATFDLNSIEDADRIPLARRGQYFVRAISVTDTNIYGDSPDFRLAIITVDAFRRDWMFGTDGTYFDRVMPKVQPREVTGVEITELAAGHSQGFFCLDFISTGTGSDIVRQIAWRGGPHVPVTSAYDTYYLKGSDNKSWAEVKIRDPLALPAISTKEEILVTKDEYGTASIRRLLDQAAEWVEETALHVYLEPTNVVTDIDPTTIQFGGGAGAPSPLFADTDFDKVVQPLTYYPVGAAKWIHIQFPNYPVLRIDSLFGAIANTRIVDIELDWIEISEKNGFVQLVPFNQEIAFDFIGLVWVESLRGAAELPNFWHFNAMVGMREGVPGDLRELMAKKAAIDVLTMYGLARIGPRSSTSLARDGISESVSYITSLQYGIYSAAIQNYKDWIERELPRLRGRYRGANMMVL